jgi:hypothetical protein
MRSLSVHEQTPALREFADQLSEHSLVPLWDVLAGLVPKEGEITTVRDIANQEGLDEGDVSRFLPLVFLAPDIVEAILAGVQPVELIPEKLKRLRNLPKSWEEQRQLLGFTG